MKDHRSNERIFELIISDALADLWDKELEEIYNDEPEQHNFSKEFERNIHKIRKSIGRKERIKKTFGTIIKIIIFFAAFIGVAMGGLLTKPRVYAAVRAAIIEIFDNYDKYEYVNSDLTVETFNNNIRLSYIPNGYYLSNGSYSPVYVSLTYTNEDKEMYFSYSIADGYSANFNNEYSTYHNFEINNVEYHYYDSYDEKYPNIIIWNDGGYAFSIVAYISCDELIEIAENIE